MPSHEPSRYSSGPRRSTYSDRPPRASLASLDEPYTPKYQQEQSDLPKRTANNVHSSPQEQVIVTSSMKYLPDHPIICRKPDNTWCEIRCWICHG